MVFCARKRCCVHFSLSLSLFSRAPDAIYTGIYASCSPMLFVTCYCVFIVRARVAATVVYNGINCPECDERTALLFVFRSYNVLIYFYLCAIKRVSVSRYIHCNRYRASSNFNCARNRARRI